MNKIKLLSVDGSLLDANFEVTADLFVEEVHKQAMFDVVLSENAAERQGTHSTLTKGEVRGGGKKPWRQKHTGKARTGSTRNPHWTGGGVVFGPKPNRNYAKKVNQKVRLLAFKSALTIKLNNQALYALDANAALEVPSTKKMVEFINTANFQNQKVLIALNDKNENIAKSSANLQKVIAKKWNQVSVRDVMHANVVVVAQDMLAKK
ncbi:50S ribosomal protein L4 [Ureaplasma zalophigenitalium]|uniref:Large ribosomal subunit protein uL4 n=1 Tax=Ureaplasma zalophigenitalium TaxID=907723 RepID=A0ABT3BNR0_9BACT|nr:50S ribosomal protein L4 [Ureaplasma zalophigenitalium]MCV3753876.1 50S ribosomal protein L4 [Ureaplasma zalophigenitalium]